MEQTTIPTLQEILEKYKEAFLEKLEWHCRTYKIIGSGTRESPMWFQYRGYPDITTENRIEFASSQASIAFTIELDPEDSRYFHSGNYHTIYQYFRTLKYNYIQEQHPTIWRELR